MSPINVVNRLEIPKVLFSALKSENNLLSTFVVDLNSYGAHPEVPQQIFLGRNINPWSGPQSVITHADES